MRVTPILALVMLVVSSGAASGQSIEMYGSAGPTITDAGHSLTAGAGFSPTSRLTLLFAFERTHLSSRTRRDGTLVSSFRGGTLWLGTAEVQFAPFGRNRLGPFGLAGVATGVSRPNVNATFPNTASHHVNTVFFGGGLNVPVGTRTTVFADARMMIGAEGNEGLVAIAPLRAGVAWRF